MEILSPKYYAAVFAHTAATVSKTVYLINSRVLLPLNDAAANAENVFAYDVPHLKAAKAAVALAVGDTVYWDDSAKNFTTTATANTKAGMAVAAAASGDAEGEIHLMQFP